MKHQHNSNGREWLMVEVPEDATDIALRMSYLDYSTQGGNTYESLPDGTWQIHSDSQTITEEQAGEIVEKVHIRVPEEWAYKNYTEGFKIDKIGVTIGYSFAIDSYKSLLENLGISDKRVINLKRT